MKLVAVVPAYNAEATVGPAVLRTRSIVGDVIVVDDGSGDGTLEEARAAGARVIRFDANRGKGAALRAGFAAALEAGAAGVVTLDADGQHDPDEIPVLVQAWRRSHAGLIIGSREDHLEGMQPRRRFGNRFSRAAVSFFAGVNVPDPQSGLRIYDASLLRVLPLWGARYELESEVIVKAARRGIRIESVPIRLAVVDGSGSSHYRPWRDTARICVWVVVSWAWSRLRS